MGCNYLLPFCNFGTVAKLCTIKNPTVMSQIDAVNVYFKYFIVVYITMYLPAEKWINLCFAILPASLYYLSSVRITSFTRLINKNEIEIIKVIKV